MKHWKRKVRLTVWRRFPFLVLVLSCFWSAGAALAHPHAYAEYQLAFVFDNKGLAGIKVRMTFDEMFSTVVLEELDPELYEEENPALNQNHIEELELVEFKDYNYFIHIMVDGKNVSTQQVREFSARIEGGQLIYDFFVPCTVQADFKPKHVVVSVFDDTYYREMSLMKESISFEGDNKFSVKYDVKIIEEFTYHYGGLKLVPEGVFIELKAKTNE